MFSYYHIIILLYYYIVIWLYCYIVIILYYYFIIFLDYWIVVLFNWYIVILLYDCIIISLYYYIRAAMCRIGSFTNPPKHVRDWSCLCKYNYVEVQDEKYRSRSFASIGLSAFISHMERILVTYEWGWPSRKSVSSQLIWALTCGWLTIKSAMSQPTWAMTCGWLMHMPPQVIAHVDWLMADFLVSQPQVSAHMRWLETDLRAGQHHAWLECAPCGR